MILRNTLYEYIIVIGLSRCMSLPYLAATLAGFLLAFPTPVFKKKMTPYTCTYWWFAMLSVALYT